MEKKIFQKIAKWWCTKPKTIKNLNFSRSAIFKIIKNIFFIKIAIICICKPYLIIILHFLQHPEYKNDSIVTESMTYDLLSTIDRIEKGELSLCDALRVNEKDVLNY